MSLIIRQALPDDLSACHHIESACFPEDEAAPETSIRTRIERFPEGFYVAELDGVVVGQVNSGCTDKDDITDEAFKKLVGHEPGGRNMVVFSLSVLPEHQGKGIAKALMLRFAEASRRLEKERVLLLCKDGLLGFYEKMGFTCRGISACTHGGARWNEMSLFLEALVSQPM